MSTAAATLSRKDRRQQIHEALRSDGTGVTARLFRALHHVVVAGGLGVMLADTVQPWQQAYGTVLAVIFHIVALFFLAEYAARLYAAPAAPGARHRAPWRVRLIWARSPIGLFDLAGALPGLLLLGFDTEDAIVFGILWVLKLVRYSPGLASLGRVVRRARRPLLSVLLAFAIVLVAAASLAFLFEHRGQPRAFGSIPAALWWAIETMTTTGYGEATPHTALGRMLAGFVMIGGITVLALWAGILATGFAAEIRRRAFLETWGIVAKMPFFAQAEASVIADVARLLRPRSYPAGAAIMHRGEPGDCMYFIASGAVEVRLRRAPVRLVTGDFFGEIALLTGAPRNATVVAAEPSTLLRLDIVEFRELLGNQPVLAGIIQAEAERRLGGRATAKAG